MSNARPFFDANVSDLERRFDECGEDVRRLEELMEELNRRSARRAVQLREKVRDRLNRSKLEGAPGEVLAEGDPRTRRVAGRHTVGLQVNWTAAAEEPYASILAADGRHVDVVLNPNHPLFRRFREAGDFKTAMIMAVYESLVVWIARGISNPSERTLHRIRDQITRDTSLAQCLEELTKTLDLDR